MLLLFRSRSGSTPPIPVVVNVTVRATRVGFFDGNLIQIGETFYIHAAADYSPYWMTFVDDVPPSWVGALEPFLPRVDDEIVRWPGKDETRLDAPGGPYAS